MRKILVVALIASASASAATKLDEGFATRIKTDGHFVTGVNRVNTATAGDDLYYWIQWKDHPTGKATFRCVIKSGSADGETLFDESETMDDAQDEGYSTCGLETDDAGTYYFAQYLNGEKVGDRTITIANRSFFGKVSVYRQFKWALGGLAVIILAIYWVRKKMGKGNEIDRAFPGLAGKGAANAAPIVIGSRVEGTAPAPAAPAPKPPDPAEMLKAFKARVAADPAYRIAKPEDVLPMAKMARAAGDPQAAVAALRGFDKAFPGHELIPDVFIFTAKLMAEDLKNLAMARKILEHIVAKHPGHYLTPDAKKYLQALPPA